MQFQEDRFQNLLEAARAGSQEALGALLDSYRSHLRARAKERIPSEFNLAVDASDIVQHSLVEAAAQFLDFTGTTEEELFCWLDRILKHNSIDSIRAHRAQRRGLGLTQSLDEKSFGGPIDIPLDTPTPGTRVAQGEEFARVQQALMGLCPTDQQIIRLRFEYDLSWEEIGSEVRLPTEGVRSRYYRALTSLQQILCQDDSFSPAPAKM